MIPTSEIDSVTFQVHENTFIPSQTIRVSKIYGDGSTYCAFTSLIHHNGLLYCAFREAATHVSDGDYGVIKILRSKDGDEWEVLQSLSLINIDLRDPNLSVMPNGQLLLVCGARYITSEDYYTTKSYYSIEEKGVFSTPQPSNVPQEIDDTHCCWIWKLTWHDGTGYGVAHRTNGKYRKVSLLKTEDGVNYGLVCNYDVTGSPTEARVRFSGDEMICLLRRGTGTAECGYLGKSMPPYSEWVWSPLEIYLAGQDFVIEKEKIVCVTRTKINIGERTSMYLGDTNGNFNWSYTFPSFGSGGGDTSYAGIVYMGSEYFVSYYSKHEAENPSIYLIRMPKSMFPNF